MFSVKFMREIGAKCRKCRREGEKLFLKGERCNTQKCAVVRRNTPPGVAAKAHRGKLSEYGKQLREKQKARKIFGVTEKVFHNYYVEAERRKGLTGDNLLSLLEMRLDNIVYRAGFTDSRNQSRQMVSHGLFELNGKKVDVPSISLRPGDQVVLREKSAGNPVVAKMDSRKVKSPQWMAIDSKKNMIEIKRFPTKDEMEKSIAVNLIVEFYSR
jgi:small subunit ribosomal protein S4